MSNNTTTYFQAEGVRQSLEALPVVIEVDGKPAPWLELLEITRDSGPKLTQARFRLHAHALGPGSRFESITTAAHAGQSISVGYCCPVNMADRHQISWPLFVGVICDGAASLAGDGEEVEIMACDALSYGDGRVVDGVRAMTAAGGTVYVRSTEAVFNADGVGNCALWPIEVDGQMRDVFQFSGDSRAYWSYAGAIRYVALEYLGTDAINAATFAALQTMTAGQVLRDVEVTGLTALKAMDRLCRRAGLHYHLVEVPGLNPRIGTTLQFYRRGQGRRVSLRHQQVGEKLDLAETNVAQCSLRSDYTREPIRLIGRGVRKRFETTFVLVHGWDASLEVNNYEKYSPSTNANFLEVQDVFRKWVLNEAGDYTGAPFNRGAATDLSGVFGNANYAPRRRRFWPCLSSGPSGNSLGYYLEVSYNNGDSWWPYASAFDNVLDECAIYLSSNQFDIDMWNAIKKDVLAFRLTASIDADERLEAVLADGPTNGVHPVREVRLDLGREFKYRQVCPASIFYDTSSAELGEPNVADDTLSMRGLLRDHLDRIRRERLAGSAVLPWLRPDIVPGDTVVGLEGRDVEFRSHAYADEYAPQVQQVRLGFDRERSTTITFG